MRLRRIYVFGAGKVGRALARGLRAAGVQTTLRAARRGWPKRLDADLIVLAVRDTDLATTAAALHATGLLARRRVAVVHCAGALDAEVLAPLRGPRVAVGQLHPLLSFAAANQPPPWRGAFAHVSGDDAAVRAASAAARKLGMKPATLSGMDLQLYHAAAALLANGAAALAGVAGGLLERAGAPREHATAMLAPLLASVAANLDHVGLPAALTGPVRRGDVDAVAGHLRQLDEHAPELLPLYRALVLAQLPLAEQLAEAPLEKWRAIEKLARRR